MDFQKISDQIVDKVGGVENVVSLSHCMTRLRFVLRDEKKVDVESIREIEGVLGTTFGAGQYQVIMGKNLLNTFNTITEKYNFDSERESVTSVKSPRNFKNICLEIMNFVAGSVSPVITGIVAGGMLKLVLFILSMIYPEITTVPTYTLINILADVPFYFMPLLVAYGTSKKLGCSPVYPMVIACALLHPKFLEIEGQTTMFSLTVPILKYSSTMIPALLSTIAVYHIEKFFNKIVPGIMKTVLVGALTLLTASVFTFVILGPLGTYIGNYVVGSIIWLQGTIGPVAIGVLAGILPFMIMAGMHTLLSPFMVESFNVAGFDGLFRPALLLHLIAEGGAALAVALHLKNKEEKAEAVSIGISSIFAGITEPAIYGIALRYKKPFYAVVAGGVSGGIVAGLFGVKAYTMTKNTILALPVFQDTLMGMVVACAVTFVVSFVVGYIVGIDSKDDKKNESKNKKGEESSEILAVVDGKTFSIEDVNDDIFSKKIMGEGIAFEALDEVVKSPCSGVLTTVFPSGHAYGITRDDGVEIMVHIGIDTVSLNGKGFNFKVKQGDRIEKGDQLVKMDLEYLKTTGLDLSVMLIFINSDKKVIDVKKYGEVVGGETVVAVI